MAALPNPLRLGFGRSSRPSYEGPALARVGSRYLSGFGNLDPFMMAWKPVLRDPQRDTQEAWSVATSQAIETIHTSGWVAGGVASARGQIISEDGLRLNLKPYGGVISRDPKIQAAWARDVEGRFTVAASDPRNVDWGARYNLAGLLAQALNQYFATGEYIAGFPYAERPGTTHGTKINLMNSTRLSQANGPGNNTIQGVTLDPITGEPIGYNFHDFNLATGEARDSYVEGYGPTGRRNILHVLENGPQAVRGITPFAPMLRVIRQSDQLANSMHIMFMLQTIFAATIESGEVTEDVMRALQGINEQEDDEAAEAIRRNQQITAETGAKGTPLGSFMDLISARATWYENTNIDLGKFGKVAHLFPGEKLNFNRPQSPTLDYLNYQKHLYMEAARALGITLFQFTGSFDGYTYTTAKMAVDENWPMVLWRRAMLAQLAQAYFEAWLEEDIYRGNTILPGGLAQFYAQKALICRADWRGPPRPTADDLKTAKAKQVERAEGWSSTEQIAAGYGNDWVEVADSQATTEEYRREKELQPLPSLGGGGNGAGSAAVAGDPERSGGSQQEREARLVGALMRGDDAGVEAVLMEDERDRIDFARFANTAMERYGYGRNAA